MQRVTVEYTLISLSKSLEDDFYDLTDLHLQVLEIDDSEEDYLIGIEKEFNDVMKTL